MSNENLGLTCQFSFRPQTAGRNVQRGKALLHAKKRTEPTAQARIPRVSRILALALHFQELLTHGDIRDYADIARLGHVSRARMTQIMNLTMLAPDIQEDVLFLPEITKGRDPWNERTLREIAMNMDWATQRKMWETWRKEVTSSGNPYLPTRDFYL